MSVEARLGEAILDLEGRLVAGMAVDEAIRETAEDHHFKDAAIRIRGERLLGPLDEVKEKSDRRVALVKDGLAFKAAVESYNRKEIEVSMYDWLLSQLGRAPSYEELKAAYARSTELWLVKHMKDFEG